MENYLNEQGLQVLINLLAAQVGHKSILDKNIEFRNRYVLNIDYDTYIKFNTDQIVGDAAPYVGTAIVGSTYVA